MKGDYRAKLVGNSEWVYGNLIKNEDNYKKPYIVGSVVESNEEYVIFEYWYPVDINTICQSINIEDINQQRLYCDDIVKVPAGFGGDCSYEEVLAQIKYDPTEPGFYLYNLDSKDGMVKQDNISWDQLEKVGNYFDNPELWKYSKSQKYKEFINYAGRSDVSSDLIRELSDAGIDAVIDEAFRKECVEVISSVRGKLGSWEFRREWYYWIAKGNPIPLKDANELHRFYGKVVRVDGNCGCPTPGERGRNGVGLYHVDTPIGLKALADTIKGVEHIDKSAPVKIKNKDKPKLSVTYVSEASPNPHANGVSKLDSFEQKLDLLIKQFKELKEMFNGNG